MATVGEMAYCARHSPATVISRRMSAGPDFAELRSEIDVLCRAAGVVRPQLGRYARAVEVRDELLSVLCGEKALASTGFALQVGGRRWGRAL